MAAREGDKSYDAIDQETLCLEAVEELAMNPNGKVFGRAAKKGKVECIRAVIVTYWIYIETVLISIKFDLC